MTPRRPTIPDLAQASGVSVATVNRVLSGSPNVRLATREAVERAAAQIGFYGLGSIQARVAAARPRLCFGVILLQPQRPFYQAVARALQIAAETAVGAEVELRIEFLEDLSPQTTAARALALAAQCQAICLTSAVHPVVTDAVERIQSQGIPVFALISQLSATGHIHYVGLDNWKVGRTSAWAFANICKTPGKIGILLGNPRYRNQEMNEAGFRSYFREHAPDFTLLEPLSTFESAAVAEEMTERILAENPDLAGLYISGGGIRGVLAALKGADRSGKLVVVGYDLTEVTRAALLDGSMTMVISHPLDHLAREVVQGMIGACLSPSGNQTIIVPFDIYTSENI
jgi:LacI family transcriptional regulator